MVRSDWNQNPNYKKNLSDWLHDHGLWYVWLDVVLPCARLPHRGSMAGDHGATIKQIVGVKDLLQMMKAVFKETWKPAGVQWYCLYDSFSDMRLQQMSHIKSSSYSVSPGACCGVLQNSQTVEGSVLTAPHGLTENTNQNSAGDLWWFPQCDAALHFPYTHYFKALSWCVHEGCDFEVLSMKV